MITLSAWHPQLTLPQPCLSLLTCYGLQCMVSRVIPNRYDLCFDRKHIVGAVCRTWRAQSEVTVRGLHNLQDDSPDEIGQAIAGWMQTLQS